MIVKIIRRITGLVFVMVAGGIAEAHSSREPLVTYFTSLPFLVVLVLIIIGNAIIGFSDFRK